MKYVTRNSTELEWSFHPGFGNCFRVDYWEEGEDDANGRCKFQDESPCLLENLKADTTYFATVSSGDGSNWSSPSNAVVFTTTEGCRFAESLAMRSEKIGNEDGKDVYAVPLENRNAFLTTSKKFVFGEADQNVTVYEINSAKGFRVDFSLTIINTPDYVGEDAEKNKQNTETIRKFFDDDVSGIQQVDMVGFVLDSSECELEPVNLYIYCSLISIFDNGIKENVNFLCNYDSGEDPPLLSAIFEEGLVVGQSLFHKLENSSICIDNPYQCIKEEHLEKFLSSFALTSTKSTSVSKQALDEMKRLEATALRLRYRMKMEMAKLEELRKAMKIFNKFSSHENLKFEVNASAAKKTILPIGNYATNCINCETTCRPVPLADESGVCPVCPGKCPWKYHVNQPFKWKYIREKQVTTPGAIKKLYEAKLEKTLTRREMIKAMKSEVEVKKEDLVGIIHTVLLCSIQLNGVARVLNENWKTHCVQVRVEVSKKVMDVLKKLKRIEEQDTNQDYVKRIEALNKLQQATQFNESSELLPNDANFWKILDGLDLQFFTPKAAEEDEREEEEETDQEDGLAIER